MIVLVSAYGRVYVNGAQAREDWEAGKDFKIYGGPYTSIRDADTLVKEYGPIVIHWDILDPNAHFFI